MTARDRTLPLAIAVEAMKVSLRDQCEWLHARASEFESGRITLLSRGATKDVTYQSAIDYRRHAANLEVIIRAYESLDSTES